MLFLKKLSQRTTLGDVIKDYGVFSTEKFYGTQELRLLECVKNGERYFVLECSVTAFGGFQYRWYKLGNETLNNLKKVLEEIEI